MASISLAVNLREVGEEERKILENARQTLREKYKLASVLARSLRSTLYEEIGEIRED